MCNGHLNKAVTVTWIAALSCNRCDEQMNIVCLIFTLGGTLNMLNLQGYGVYQAQRQLDAAVDASKRSAVCLIPNMMALSSACGIHKHKALNADIVQVCIRTPQYAPDTKIHIITDFVRNKHPQAMKSYK